MGLKEIIEEHKGIEFIAERHMTGEGVLRIADTLLSDGCSPLYLVSRHFTGMPIRKGMVCEGVDKSRGEYVHLRLFTAEPEYTEQGRHPDIYQNRGIFLCTGSSMLEDLRKANVISFPPGEPIRTIEIPEREVTSTFDPKKGLMFPGLYKIETYRLER